MSGPEDLRSTVEYVALGDEVASCFRTGEMRLELKLRWKADCDVET